MLSCPLAPMTCHPALWAPVASSFNVSSGFNFDTSRDTYVKVATGPLENVKIESSGRFDTFLVGRLLFAHKF